MGEELQKGTIDEMNQIFRAKAGVDFDFFETNLATIADSYAYSMAKARGREAYIRRAMDFGDDAVKVIGQTTKMNPQLVTQLSAAHKTLLDSRAGLTSRIRSGTAKAGNLAKDALDSAEALLAGKTKQKFMTDREIAVLQANISKTEDALLQAMESASKLGADARQGFLETHKAILDQLQVMKAAVESNTMEQYAVTLELQKMYMAVYPNAKKIPTDVGRLYEGIMKARGVASPRELFALESRQRMIAKQIKDLVESGSDPEMLNALIAQEKQLAETVAGFTRLGDVRLNATYSEDGLLYTTADQIKPTAGDTPYKSYDSTLIDPMAGADDGSRVGWHESVMSDPNTVAIHAIPTDKLVDMRDPDGFKWFFSDANAFDQSVATALDNAGLQDVSEVFLNEFKNYKATGKIDPFFVEQYPALAKMMQIADGVGGATFPTNVVPDDVSAQVFDEIKQLFSGVAADVNLENSDMVGQQMFHDMIAGMVDNGVGPAHEGFVVPSSIIYGVDNPEAMGAYSVLVPNSYDYTKGLQKSDLIGKPTSKVQLTSESEVVRALREGEYDSASLDVQKNLSLVRDSVRNSTEQGMQLDALRREAGIVGGQVKNLKDEASARLVQAERTYERYNATGKIRWSTDGGKTWVEKPRKQALAEIAQTEKKVASLYNKLANEIKNIEFSETASLQKSLDAYQERLPTLLDKAAVLERWDESTGAVLRQDIDLLRQVIAERPPSGSAGVQSRQWMAKVQRTMDSIPQIQDSRVAKAYERVTTQLHADEAQLAMLDETILNSKNQLDLTKRGLMDPKIVDHVERGWKAIENLGVMVPPELQDLWKPNIEKLAIRANRGEVAKALTYMHRMFKTWAMATPGFGVRNAMSATFMNHVAGVEASAMIDGAKAAMAFRKHGGDKWLDALGLTGKARDEMAMAWRAAEATGSGMADELASLTTGSNSLAEKFINNWWTRLWGEKMNTQIERMVRLPMALDSIRKGYTYDAAVARVARYHFDYSDLSLLDEKAKAVVPFWIWTTKNIPLQLTEQFSRPAAYSQYQHIKEHNPTNADLILPQWMGEMGPMGLTKGLILTPDLPMVRLEQSGQQFMPDRIAGMLYPELKLPVELLLQNKQAALNIPFTDKYEKAKGLDAGVAWLGELLNAPSLGRRNPDTGALEVSQKAQYAVPQAFPFLSQIDRLTGGRTGGKANYSERTLSSWANFAGIPVREVTSGMQRSEAIGRQFKQADAIAALQKIGRIEKKQK